MCELSGPTQLCATRLPVAVSAPCLPSAAKGSARGSNLTQVGLNSAPSSSLRVRWRRTSASPLESLPAGSSAASLTSRCGQYCRQYCWGALGRPWSRPRPSLAAATRFVCWRRTPQRPPQSMATIRPSDRVKLVTGVRLGVLDVSPVVGGASIEDLQTGASAMSVASPRSLEACLREGVELEELEFR